MDTTYLSKSIRRRFDKWVAVVTKAAAYNDPYLGDDMWDSAHFDLVALGLEPGSPAFWAAVSTYATGAVTEYLYEEPEED